LRSSPLIGAAGLVRASLARRFSATETASNTALGTRLLGSAAPSWTKAQQTPGFASCSRLELSTSELQPAALELYRRAGYRQVREEIADQASNKTVGGGIRRYHFEKHLGGEP
jgi:hypothetical protein